MEVQQLLAYVIVRDLIDVDLQGALHTVQSTQEGAPCIIRSSESPEDLDIAVRIHGSNVSIRDVWWRNLGDRHLCLFGNEGHILGVEVVDKVIVIGLIHVVLDNRRVKILQCTLTVTNNDTSLPVLGEGGLAEVDRGDEYFPTTIHDHEFCMHEGCGAVHLDVNPVNCQPVQWSYQALASRDMEVVSKELHRDIS